MFQTTNQISMAMFDSFLYVYQGGGARVPSPSVWQARRSQLLDTNPGCHLGLRKRGEISAGSLMRSNASVRSN